MAQWIMGLNIQFVHIFAWVHKHLNTKGILGYTVNDISTLFLAHFVINYKVFQ